MGVRKKKFNVRRLFNRKGALICKCVKKNKENKYHTKTKTNFV